MLPATPTVPSVGAAGLLGPEDAHCRGAPNPSRSYSKNALVPAVRIWRSAAIGFFFDGRAHGVVASQTEVGGVWSGAIATQAVDQFQPP